MIISYLEEGIINDSITINPHFMKTIKKPSLLIILFLGLCTFSFAQTKTPSYKELVGENPNAEADIKVMSDYTNALANNKMDVAANQLSEKYVGYGPAATDSINKKEEMASWVIAHLVRTNEKVGFVSMSYRVLQGPYKGDWVAQWGDYSFTENGKDITLPFQVTARVSNGKIEMSRVYYDNLAIVTALGYTITPPKKAE